MPGVYTVWDKEFILKDPSHIFSFSGLLKLNFKEEKITGQSSCQLGYMYDVARVSIPLFTSIFIAIMFCWLGKIKKYLCLTLPDSTLIYIRLKIS